MAAKQFALECYAEFAYDDREIKQAEKILQKIGGWNEAVQMFDSMHPSPVG